MGRSTRRSGRSCTPASTAACPCCPTPSSRTSSTTRRAGARRRTRSSSVVEYAKFFSNVFVEGFNRPDELGEYLWGDNVPITNVKERKWTQYIAVANTLIANDPIMANHVSTQVSLRTEHFYRTMPPASFV